MSTPDEKTQKPPQPKTRKSNWVNKSLTRTKQWGSENRILERTVIAVSFFGLGVATPWIANRIGNMFGGNGGAEAVDAE